MTADSRTPNAGVDSDPGTVVYVVDDDPELCDSVDWLLGSIGISPRICHSAAAFLETYTGDHPACIVLDMRMPQMSGTRLQEKLNEIAPHVAIIFVSAHGDIRMSVSTMQAGALDFLEKPYDPQRLLDAVQSGMEKAAERFHSYRAHHSVAEKVASLTPREREILALVVEGLPSQNIARKLGMSVKTVDVHRARIKSKTDADSISTLVRDILRYDVTVPIDPRP
ncbi:response regulator [Gordonia sp. NB41Y]|uniref:response regulator transcription factor n=1 Tax=Gordonia sp. NB41Y TaxID=875808 RepID=UPI0002BE1D1B|nr:response regulator [Gordonia sp. NB41Y]EMP14335.1 LuxR family transcriptional regulator [Gordonia sp. NB41Y]WLP88727.1 response regulator [Gordonia sp. NB41Y]